jgi:CHAD domain-containing protein
MATVEGRTPVWLAARALLHERGSDFFRRRNGVIEKCDPERIHDLRVSSRRLREGLELFLPCYAANSMRPLIKAFRKVTRLMGDLRNTDEASSFLDRLMPEVDRRCRRDLERLKLSLQEERPKELKRLRDGLQTIASSSLRDRFRRSVDALPLLSSPNEELFSPLAAFAAKALEDRGAAVLELAPKAASYEAIDAQHKLRIAFKHLRYRTEILSMLFRTDYDHLHGQLKRYQDVLGELHDLVVFAALVEDAKFLPPARKLVLEAITARRKQLYEQFSGMMATEPIGQLCRRARSAG